MQSAVLAMIDSVGPTVRHTLLLSQKEPSYDYAAFTGGQPNDLVFMVNGTAKFQRKHRKWGRRRMREG